jgi:hypothetical protein
MFDMLEIPGENAVSTVAIYIYLHAYTLLSSRALLSQRLEPLLPLGRVSLVTTSSSTTHNEK